MFAPRFQPYLFGLIMSGMMSLIIIGISTARLSGLNEAFIATWLSGWLSAWAVAFPVVLFVAPAARKLTEKLIRQPA